MGPKDPVAKHFHVPFWLRPMFWLSLILISVAVAALALGVVASNRVTDEARHRTQQLQDVICGVYVPIGNTILPPRTSELSHTIVAATRHGAVDIHCPGVK